ncbi:unnamed protein product [Sphagnum balticum]
MTNAAALRILRIQSLNNSALGSENTFAISETPPPQPPPSSSFGSDRPTDRNRFLSNVRVSSPKVSAPFFLSMPLYAIFELPRRIPKHPQSSCTHSRQRRRGKMGFEDGI